MLTGAWLVTASVCFWLSWALMPGVGITDTAAIFALVSRHRSEVLASVIVQLVSAAAYAPGLAGVLLSDAGRRSKALQVGCVLLLVGAMGSAADSIFHLVLYEMTAPDVDLRAMIPVMQRLQGPDLALILPLVLAFFGGHAVIVSVYRRRDGVAKLAFVLLLSVPVVAAAGAMAARAAVVSGRVVGLAVLLALSGSLTLVGISLGRAPSAA